MYCLFLRMRVRRKAGQLRSCRQKCRHYRKLSSSTTKERDTRNSPVPSPLAPASSLLPPLPPLPPPSTTHTPTPQIPVNLHPTIFRTPTSSSHRGKCKLVQMLWRRGGVRMWTQISMTALSLCRLSKSPAPHRMNSFMNPLMTLHWRALSSSTCSNNNIYGILKLF